MKRLRKYLEVRESSFSLMFNGFEYYSSLAESVYNILLFSHNRSFAETVMNLLTEDSGWIYYRELDTLDLTKVIIGGGLLVLARAALRK